jgi:hypothetical protein
MTAAGVDRHPAAIFPGLKNQHNYETFPAVDRLILEF